MQYKNGIHELTRWQKLLHFFPFQLLLLHLKHNHFFLIIWSAMFALITSMAGTKYGVPYLLLSPEYLDVVNFWSFAALGFSVGGFIMAFNIYTYMMYGFKFPFIATVSRPFLKFCINNFIIPLTFIVVHVVASLEFQMNDELIAPKQAITHVIGYLTGIAFFFALSFYYFFRTNKDIFRIGQRRTRKARWSRFFGTSSSKQSEGPTVKTTFHRRRKVEPISFEYGWFVSSYISQKLRIRIARTPEHYDEETLRRVFQQNHLNASLYELVLLISFLVIGSFKENILFAIPAGASVFLMITILVMLYSILFSYLRWWTPTILTGIVLTFNWLSADYDWLRFHNEAYGLNYDVAPASYTMKDIHALASAPNIQNDLHRGVEILNNWKSRQAMEKPMLVIINSSGGGLRSTIWSFRVMQVLDSLTNGGIMQQAHLITGSSGGMMGMAYFRELYRNEQRNIKLNIQSPYYLEHLGKDLLNPIALSIATTDMFVRYQFFKDGAYRYAKDRGYAFEQKFNENTLGLMKNNRLRDYTTEEYQSIIPMMVFSPTIINDGRRLIIASQPVSYLSAYIDSVGGNYYPTTERVEFTRMFRHQDGWNLRFTSAIRMSATFPYVLPMVTLPSEPRTEVMDAGLRDNLGMKLSLQYIQSFRDWIKENCGGVLIIRIRDAQKENDPEGGIGSLMYRIMRPLGSLYGNFILTQEYDTDQMLHYLSPTIGVPVHVSEIVLDQSERKISLSWHLTALEKQNLLKSVFSPQNMNTYQQIIQLLNR